MDRFEKRPIIYTAYSKHYFYAKMLVSSCVLGMDCIPLNPFANFGYFMDDLVDRELVIRGNNNLILIADEVWTFGPVADGVYAEVRLAHSLGKPVRHFSIGKKLEDIHPLEADKLEFEKELLEKFKKKDLLKEFGIYLSTPS